MPFFLVFYVQIQKFWWKSYHNFFGTATVPPRTWGSTEEVVKILKMLTKKYVGDLSFLGKTPLKPTPPATGQCAMAVQSSTCQLPLWFYICFALGSAVRGCGGQEPDNPVRRSVSPRRPGARVAVHERPRSTCSGECQPRQPGPATPGRGVMRCERRASRELKTWFRIALQCCASLAPGCL